MTKLNYDRWLLTLLDDAKRARRDNPNSDHQRQLTSDKPDPDTHPCNPYLESMNLRTQSKSLVAYHKSKAAYAKKQVLLKSGGIVPVKTENLAQSFEKRRVDVLLCCAYLLDALHEEHQKTGTSTHWVELLSWWIAMHRREFGNPKEMQKTIDNAFDLLCRLSAEEITQGTLENSP